MRPKSSHHRPSVHAIWWAAFAALLCTVSNPVSAAAQMAAARTGLQQNIQFDHYASSSRNDELVSRLLSPLAAALVRKRMDTLGQHLPVQAVDLATERFTIYAPPKPPPDGYGLLVFVPPWNEARLPSNWTQVLDQYGVIAVTAARSGNDADVISRRVPLALLGAQNIIDLYPVNPDRIFVGGFSGGSHVAMRIALTFPDLFSGAFLDAGSDPVGDEGSPAPADVLLQRFQEHSKLVAITGSEDEANIAKDAEAAQSMVKWCQFNFDQKTTPFLGHQVAGPSGLSQTLAELYRPPVINASRLAACRASLETDLATSLTKAQAQVSAGRPGRARQLIYDLDRRFGGFAGDRIVNLAKSCRCTDLDLDDAEAGPH